MGCFETVRQDASLPVDLAHADPRLFELRGAYVKDGEIRIRLPNKHRTDYLKLTARRPSRYLRRRSKAVRRESSELKRGGASEGSRHVAPNMPNERRLEYRDGRWQWARSPAAGQLYFKSTAARRRAIQGGTSGPYAFVRGRDGRWVMEGVLLPITAPQDDANALSFIPIRRGGDIPPGLKAPVVQPRTISARQDQKA